MADLGLVLDFTRLPRPGPVPFGATIGDPAGGPVELITAWLGPLDVAAHRAALDALLAVGRPGDEVTHAAVECSGSALLDRARGAGECIDDRAVENAYAVGRRLIECLLWARTQPS